MQKSKRQRKLRPRRFSNFDGWRCHAEQLEQRNLLATISLAPTADNTLYTPFGDETPSNGAGQHIFTGLSGNGIRRGLMKFDFGEITSGATIESVSLSLSMSRTNGGPVDISLHRVLSGWGEGSSDAPNAEGGGADPEVGDATWLHTFWPDQTWASAGGDFVVDASATTVVDAEGVYSWTDAGLVDDVQSWVSGSSPNFGWLIQGVDAAAAKRFDSKDNLDSALHPELIVTYTEAEQTIDLFPVADGTLYEAALAGEQYSNGIGEHFFTGLSGNGNRRGLLKFDFSEIDVSATIRNVELTLSMSRTNGGDVDMSLHPVFTDWGEGSSDAPGAEGAGAPPTEGDVTWLHSSWPDSFWDSPGGDFFGQASAVTSVGDEGSYSWSGEGLIGDVQGWLNGEAENYGWLVQGVNADAAKRFDSKDHSDVSVRPRLTIVYTADSSGDGDQIVTQITPLVGSDMGTRASVEVDFPIARKLDAWVDFDRNGVFDNPESLLPSGPMHIAPGKNIVTFTIPPNASIGTTQARFVLSEAGGRRPDEVHENDTIEVVTLSIQNALTSPMAFELVSGLGVYEIRESSGELQFGPLGNAPWFIAPTDDLADLQFLGTGASDEIEIVLPNAHTGSIGFDLGAGQDSIKLGQSVPVKTFAPSELSGVEKLDISGAGENGLLLDQDVVPSGLLLAAGPGDTATWSGDGWRYLDSRFESNVFTVEYTNGVSVFRTQGLSPWHNLVNRIDVNGDNEINPQDVLVMVNRINGQGKDLPIPPLVDDAPPHFFDVNKDGKVLPEDVLIVVNHINRALAGEGELLQGELILEAATSRTPSAPTQVRLEAMAVDAALADAAFRLWDYSQ